MEPAAAALNAALGLWRQGRAAEARRELEGLLSRPGLQCTRLRSTAMLVLATLRLLAGRDVAGLAGQIGARFALSPGLFHEPSATRKRRLADRCGPVRAVDGAVPEPALASLRAGFSGERYWRAVGYDTPEQGYCSWWCDPRSKPRHPVEALVQRLFEAQGRPAAVVGAEWWAHRRAGGHPGHRLHWDTDESGRPGIRHPIESTVLMLDPGSGGSTVVLNQRLGQPMATEAWAVPARAGRLIRFPGDLLHGVLPAGGKAEACRLTLMVGWWAEEITSPGGGLGACMRLPEELPEWTAGFGQWSGRLGAGEAVDLATERAWLPVAACELVGSLESVPEDLNQHFFVESREELEHEYIT